ncbi:biotin--[acetyl-CoA-carboxylase] ligase [Neisseriaceae bacterium ESL0693]|nr:biotin--[acetyl-CoA-carboxylase] ligase [Neisseriaceae bacterium ESL0693]
MNTPLWSLLALLSDGQPHDVHVLSQKTGFARTQLESLWRKMPPHIQALLQKHDDVWQLHQSLAIMSPQAVQKVAARYGLMAEVLPQTTSTNSVLLQLARTRTDGAHQRLCMAYEQTAGRGRQGRPWHNRLGECLMFSLAWSFNQPQAGLGGLALIVALAVCQSLRDQQIPAQIKWPNDLVLGQQKLCGILIETVPHQHKTSAVIGIGLNFVLPDQLDQPAAALTTVLPKVNTTEIFSSIIQKLTDYLPRFEEHGLTPFLLAYEQLHRDHLQPVHLLKNGQPLVEGTVAGIAPTGALRLQTAQGERCFVSGEISLRAGMVTSSPARGWSLLLDAGNSKLKWAWIHHNRVMHINKAAYYDLQKLVSDWQQYGANTALITGCAVCGEARMQQIAQALPQPIKWLGSMPHALGIHNHYRRPAEHGADRWFNVLGSRRYTDKACVIVSCGTAVTVDALTHDNHYLGGSILPGFHLMKEALAQRTANLNRPLGRPYAFATTTSNALASGIMDAVCGAIVLMHDRLQQKIGADNKIDIIITGGGASKIAQTLPAAFVLDKRIEIVDNLVIYGLLNWVENS